MGDRPLTALVQTVLDREDKIQLERMARERHHTLSSLVRAVVLDWMATQDRGGA